jgi:hypothetical protein
MRRFVPGSSQNRTWSVTPSGSQPEPFAVEQGSDPAPCRLRHRRQPPQCRASRAPPQGQPRQLRETRERQCHGQSPLGVGPCFTLALSQTATPLLDPHYRASQLVWVAPTSTHHRPRPRFYTCSRVPASSGPMRGSPWLPRVLNVRLDTASDPGEYPCRSPERDTDCCLPAGQTRRHSPTKIFGAQHLQGRLTRYLCTSPAFVPTHRRACYQSRRKARYWARGSRLPRRDSHPLEHAALPGRTVPVFPYYKDFMLYDVKLRLTRAFSRHPKCRSLHSRHFGWRLMHYS